MGAEPLAPADLADIAGVYAHFVRHPVVVLHAGRGEGRGGRPHLGPVGGRIVAETLIGLLRADPTSYLSASPGFRPFLGRDLAMGTTPDTYIVGDRTYTRAHFLYYAGSSPQARTASGYLEETSRASGCARR